MDWKAIISIVFGSLGLAGTVFAGMVYLVWEAARDQDLERRAVETRIQHRIETEIRTSRERDKRQDDRHLYSVQILLDLYRRVTMPWTSQDANRFTKKAKTKEQKEEWASIANSVLKHGGSEQKAIKIANSIAGGGKKRRRSPKK